uniref:(northern house mosquito) hypothetical protein n=1 Tax=Culex pipiens TaxID=7175 RepID=A0A8D8KYM9_CULPI
MLLAAARSRFTAGRFRAVVFVLVLDGVIRVAGTLLGRGDRSCRGWTAVGRYGCRLGRGRRWMDRAVEGRIGPLELLVLRELRQVLDVRVELQRDVLLLAKLFKGQVQGDLWGWLPPVSFETVLLFERRVWPLLLLLLGGQFEALRP